MNDVLRTQAAVCSVWAAPGRGRVGPAPSEAHPHPPGVGGQGLVLLPDHAGVCALVDGVGRDADVVVLQGDVPGPGVLQELPVFVPAERWRRWRTA